MANIIKIKRSDSTNTPGSNLVKGELGYSYSSNKLFIGDGSTFDTIGGQVYVQMLDHTAGTLTASSAIITDSSSKIDNLLVDNIQINGNTISTSSGNLIITPTGGTVDYSAAAIEFKLVDNSATGMTVATADHTYMTFDTTNAGEKVTMGRSLDMNGLELILDADGDTTITADTDDVIDFKIAGTDELKLAADSLRPASNAGLTLGTSSLKFGAAFVDNLKLDGSTLSSTNTNGDINITPNGTGSVVIDGLSFPQADGTANQFLKTDGSGTISFADVSTSFTLAADNGTNDTFNTGSTLTFTGSEGIDTTVSDDTITIAAELATYTNKGVASFSNTNFTVTSGAVTTADVTFSSDSGSAAGTLGETITVSGGEGIDTSATGSTITIAAEDATASNKGVASFSTDNFLVTGGAVTIKDGGVANAELANSAVTVGTTSISLGSSSTSIAGVTQLDVDNLRLDGNVLSSTNSNGNISLNPNGTGTVDVNTSRIVNVTDPTGAQDAATKAYVDSVKQALDIKDSVRVATTANITIASDLNVGDTIDGVTLADGDRVLVKDQSTGSENGIYVAGATPARSGDANVSAEVTSGMFMFVEEGTVNGDNGFVLTTNDSITLGTTALTFTQFSGAGQVIAGDALSKSGNTLNVNDDNITLEVNSDSLRIKGISATAVGDILLGASANGGYTRHTKPGSTATALSYILSMDTAGNARWADVLDGGSF
jgi:hypothetical protein